MVANKKNVLTQEGYEKLVKELHELKSEKLPQVIERIAEARAQGDLSENFDYKAALEDRDLVESRITEIENLIDDVEIIKGESHKGDTVVDYGSTATVETEEGKQYTVTIVGTGEVDMDNDKNLHISFESPLGAAIRGKKAGETGKMKLHNGRQPVKVISIQ